MTAALTTALVLFAAACFGWVATSRALGREKTARDKACAELVDTIADAEWWREMSSYSKDRVDEALATIVEERKRAIQYATRLRVMEEHASDTYALPVYRSTLPELTA